MQQGVGVKPHHATVAVHERMDPAQAMVGRCRCDQGGFATAHAGIEIRPAVKEVRNAAMGWGNVLSDAYVTFPEFARLYGRSLGRDQVCSGQAAKELAVQVLHRTRRV